MENIINVTMTCKMSKVTKLLKKRLNKSINLAEYLSEHKVILLQVAMWRKVERTNIGWYQRILITMTLALRFSDMTQWAEIWSEESWWSSIKSITKDRLCNNLGKDTSTIDYLLTKAGRSQEVTSCAFLWFNNIFTCSKTKEWLHHIQYHLSIYCVCWSAIAPCRTT